MGQIENYLADRKYAIQGIFQLLNIETGEIEKLTLEIEELRHTARILRLIAIEENEDEESLEEKLSENDEFLASLCLDSDADGKKNRIEILNEVLMEKKDSITTFSMCLLQIAKQGISSIYGENKNSCTIIGRNISSNLSLRDIIWEGRNQAIHYEGNYRNNITECFRILTTEFGEQFNLSNSKENKAKYIIDLLGWKDFESFEKDLLLFEKEGN